MTKTEKMVGAGIGIAAVAALGTYFLYGKNGAKNREKISGWMLKMKGEVLDKVEEVKEINKETYFKIVDEVALRYNGLEKVGSADLHKMTEDLKTAWEHLSKELK